MQKFIVIIDGEYNVNKRGNFLIKSEDTESISLFELDSEDLEIYKAEGVENYCLGVYEELNFESIEELTNKEKTVSQVTLNEVYLINLPINTVSELENNEDLRVMLHYFFMWSIKENNTNIKDFINDEHIKNYFVKDELDELYKQNAEYFNKLTEIINNGLLIEYKVLSNDIFRYNID